MTKKLARLFSTRTALIALCIVAAVSAVAVLETSRTQTEGEDLPDPQVDATCQEVITAGDGEGRVMISGYGVGGSAVTDTPTNLMGPVTIVAHVKAAEQTRTKCTDLHEGIDADSRSQPIMSTIVGASVLEYFKGNGPNYLELEIWGGAIGSFTTSVDGFLSWEDFPAGSEGIVFLSQGRDGAWLVEDAYLVEGGAARSALGGKQFPKDELLADFRAARTGID